jgi:hypothetical protein
MRSLIVCCAAWLAVPPAISFADTHDKPRIGAIQETKVVNTLSPQEDRALSLATGRILKHVNRARVALAEQDKKGAQHHVDQGLVLLRIIDATLPKYSVKTRIEAGQYVYEDQGEEQPRFIPIYEGVEKLAILAPIEGEKEATAADFQITAAPVISDVDLVKSRASLDIALARAGLTTAAAALKKERRSEADLALAQVQRGVILKRLKIDLPLEEARANLWLAKELLIERKPADARTALRSAADALAAHEKSAGESRAKDVQTMREQIGQLVNSIETDQSGAIAKIMGWWEQIHSWAA